MAKNIETRIVESTGKVQSMGTGSIVPQGMYSVEIKGASGEWQSSGVYQPTLSEAERHEREYQASEPHWFFEGWFRKVTSP